MTILYCKTTSDTALKLAEKLGIPSYNPYQADGTLGRPTKVIRWGVGCGIGYVPRLVLNKMKAVNNAVNKLAAIDLFNVKNVRTAARTNEVPCVGRTREHTQGQNFWLCWEEEQVETAAQEGAEYFIEYIPIKQEYRVHVIENEVAFIQRKYPKDRVSTAFMGVQGFSNQWHKKVYTGRVSGDVKTTAVDAVKALGLDFGGVDILVSMKNNKAYVAEVNTGPALHSDVVLAPYVKYFKAKLDL